MAVRLTSGRHERRAKTLRPAGFLVVTDALLGFRSLWSAGATQDEADDDIEGFVPRKRSP
jgi:hypothetical protein